MGLYGQKSKSIPQKATILILELLILFFAYIIAFNKGGSVIYNWFGIEMSEGDIIQRHIWKKDTNNKGKLYTIGLFKYSMHINYFGDLLWVIAYTILTYNAWSVGIPIFLFLFFAFYNIPKLDKYLAEKYKDQFEEYKKKTKKFIPFIY